MNKNIYSVIGGDLRQAYLAELIARSGLTVFLAGAENSPYIPDGVFITDVVSAIKFSKTIILPLPASRDGKTINAPFCEKPVNIQEISPLLCGKRILAGMTEGLPSFDDSEIFDYYQDELLLIENALLTAEGAIAVAAQDYPGRISGAKCLITGYGRIGKVLCKKLKALDANVYVAARKLQDRIWINNSGATAVEFNNIAGLAKNIDIVFNTVPAPVINEEIIKNLSKNSVIIDLASAPGGTDFSAAAGYSVKAMLLPGIPGKYSPLAAAEIIKETIFRIIEEAEK